MGYINKGLTLPEIFEIVEKCKTKNEKIKKLRDYDSNTLRWYIDNLYNTDWTNVPDYKQFKNKKRPIGNSHLTVSTSIKRLETVKKYMGKNNNIAEKNLGIVLEEVSEEEYKLLINMFKNKKIEGLSKNIWKEVYPQFFRFEETG